MVLAPQWRKMRRIMVHLSQPRRVLIWALMAAIVALLCLLGFRGYLSSEMLLNFANMFYC